MQDLIGKIQALTEIYWGYSLEKEVEKLFAENGWTIASKEMSWSSICRPVHQHPVHGDWNIELFDTSDPERFKCRLVPVDGDGMNTGDPTFILFSPARAAQIKEFQRSILAQYQPDPYEDSILEEVA